MGFICSSAGGVAGYSVSGPATYTATINGETFQGTGSVSATLYAQSGAKDSVSESVTVSYGQIAGAAIDRATSAPIAGICVKAYNSSGCLHHDSPTSRLLPSRVQPRLRR